MEELCRLIEANYQSLTGISQVYLSEQRRKLDLILQGYVQRLMALQRYEKMPMTRNSRDIEEEIEGLEQELADPGLNERAAAALKKNLELKRRLLDSLSEVGGTVKALYTELDSMESLLEVLHQNSISLRDPQAISQELDAIVRQSEESDRIVREMETLLRGGTEGWQSDILPETAPPLVSKTPAGSEPRGQDQAAMTTPFVHYPRWAQTLAHGIRARLGNTFLLHGNTLDLLPAPKAQDEPRTIADFLPLTRFLGEWVFGQRDVVIEYQRANGAIFHTRESHKHFMDTVETVDAVHGTSFATTLPREPVAFCALLDSFLKQVVHRKRSSALR